MKRFMALGLVLMMAAYGVIGFSATSYASDWDKAGKILTGIEGVRILTGGRFDLIGNMFGISNQQKYGYQKSHPAPRKHHVKKRRYCSQRVWVPHYVWERKYIPEHREYTDEYGDVVVEGHYIKYKVERGGEWITTCHR